MFTESFFTWLALKASAINWATSLPSPYYHQGSVRWASTGSQEYYRSIDQVTSHRVIPTRFFIRTSLKYWVPIWPMPLHVRWSSVIAYVNEKEIKTTWWSTKLFKIILDWWVESVRDVSLLHEWYGSHSDEL